MKKITLLLLLFLSSLSQAQIATVAGCSNLDSNTYGPMYSIATANATNRTAVIYPASQLVGISGQELTAAYFKRVTATGQMAGTPTLKIYLKEVVAADWGTTGIDWATSITDAVLVYNSNPATATGSTAGWKGFNFATNFTYSGTKNLAVFMEYTNPTASTAIAWNYEYTDPCINTLNNKTTKYSNNTTGVLPATLSTSDYRRPFIGFDFVVSCPAPINFASANLTTTSVDLSWVAGGTETNWEYAVLPSTAATPTNGTQIAANSVTGVPLSPSTVYTAYVRAICGDDDNSIWKTITFTTPCAAITTFPWTEGFESLTTLGTTNFPLCWTKENGDWSTSNATTYNTARTGTKYLRDYYNAVNEYMWTPGFQLVAGTSYDFSTFVQGDNFSGWVVDMFYNTSASATGATQLGASYAVPGNAAGPAAIVSYNEMRRAFVPQTSGVYYFAVRVNMANTSAWYLAFDDFKLELTPACPVPTSLAIGTINSVSAIATWTGPSVADSYNIEYGVTGFTPGTGTLVSDVTSPYTFAGLNSNTTYQFYVQSDCTDTQSTWSTPFSFTTTCSAFAIPTVAEGFEVTTQIPSCWSRELVTGTTQWAVFAPTGAGDIATAHTGTKIISKPYTSSDALLITNALDYSDVEEPTRINVWLYRHASAHINDKYRFHVNTSASLTGAIQISEIFLKTTIAPLAPATGWYNYTFDIPEAMEGQSQVYVIVQGITANGFSSYTLGIDDFIVEFTPALSAPSFNANNFKVYPNPVNNILNVASAEIISSVSVFNLLGQQVLVKSVNATEGTLDVSSLASGTYVVKVSANDTVGTYKIIKQ